MANGIFCSGLYMAAINGEWPKRATPRQSCFYFALCCVVRSSDNTLSSVTMHKCLLPYFHVCIMNN